MASAAIDWTAIGSISTALALVLGAGTLYWQHRSQLRRDEYERSKFALNSCLETYQKALERLEDGNNDRVTWVTSARMIERANELATLVRASPHLAVLEVEKELFRDRAAAVLGYKDPAKGDWFYRGFDEPECEHDAARNGDPVLPASSRHGRGHGPATELSLASVATVYELASFPKDYEEPLRGHNLEARVGVEMRASFPGLFAYLTTNFGRERASPGEEA